MIQQDMNILFVHILFSYNTVALTNCCNGKTYSLQSEYSCLEICQPKLFNLFEKVNGPFPSTLILIVYTVHDKLLSKWTATKVTTGWLHLNSGQTAQ